MFKIKGNDLPYPIAITIIFFGGIVFFMGAFALAFLCAGYVISFLAPIILYKQYGFWGIPIGIVWDVFAFYLCVFLNNLYNKLKQKQ